MKHFSVFILLLYTAFSYGQNTTKIAFEYNNPSRINSFMKIVVGYPENDKPVVVYCDIYDKNFKKKFQKKSILKLLL